RTSDAVYRATADLLKEEKEFLHTITGDNGNEIADHQKIAQELQIRFYFAKPYHSWERGANENRNGLIRQYTPKKNDFKTIDDEFLQLVANSINSRPRKRYSYKSPIFVKNLLLTKAKVAFVA
ncbi:MAG TPA: IS30 family transposase, partial [Bacteroidetes bacterium]|nr:IS30 family transposase [Bacteroidota bacterium]